MKIALSYEEKVPSYALSYLINGDASGLTDGEITTIDLWYSRFVNVARKESGYILFSPKEETSEEYFDPFPAFGKASNCIDCIILIVKNEPKSINHPI